MQAHGFEDWGFVQRRVFRFCVEGLSMERFGLRPGLRIRIAEIIAEIKNRACLRRACIGCFTRAYFLGLYPPECEAVGICFVSRGS